MKTLKFAVVTVNSLLLLCYLQPSPYILLVIITLTNLDF